ncbi:MAG: PEP-CTERM sorting domain-containing protein [Acidobacteriota bacterium]
MKKICTTALLSTAMFMVSSVPAQASQLTVVVTVGQIINAFATTANSGLTANCLSNLSDCGIFGIGLVSDTLGTLNLTNSHGITAPAAGLPDAWVPKSINGLTNPGFEAGGNPNTVVAFITNDTHLLSTGTPYTANTLATAQNGAPNSLAGDSTSGIGMLSTGTTLSFLLDYGMSNVAAGVDNITFEVLVAKFNSNGTQASKNILGTIVVNGLNATTLTTAPEPSSVALLLGGIAVIGWRRFRRDSNN